MKTFVEFGHETSHTNPLPMHNSKLDLQWYLTGACFHFIGLFFHKAFPVKVKKTRKKTLFRGSCYKMLKVKNYFFLLIYTLSIVIQK